MKSLQRLAKIGLTALALAGAAHSPAPAAEVPVLAAPIAYRTVKIAGLDIFYREAGPKEAPIVLLLHGFPSSSHMFRDLIPLLAGKYHVIAPDYPGFGHSSQPNPQQFPYTFAALADVAEGFVDAVGAKNYFIYMQDYGGPVGLRLAIKHPERVRGFIVQNAAFNAEAWSPDIGKVVAPLWSHRDAASEAPVRDLVKPETTRFQYTFGATRAERLSPDAWTNDQAGLDRPGNADIQLELLFNYQDNFANYPKWGEFLRAQRLPMLIVWGRNDPFFQFSGVDYLKAQAPQAEVHLFDAGHFALETHGAEIAADMLDFLDRASAK